MILTKTEIEIMSDIVDIAESKDINVYFLHDLFKLMKENKLVFIGNLDLTYKYLTKKD
jgi:hypothetical protein